jgi:K+/H+ antiporter YhaU regulatory subunit KhtT
VAFREVRIRSESSAAGQTIRKIPISSLTGVAILAVSRAGRVHYDLGPDFQVYPGDRVVLIGFPDELREAERMLNEFETAAIEESPDRFDIAEVQVAENSPLSGHTLEELHFRAKFRVTVVGIRRGESQITRVYPAQLLSGGDHLIVVGAAGAVEELKKQEPL